MVLSIRRASGHVPYEYMVLGIQLTENCRFDCEFVLKYYSN